MPVSGAAAGVASAAGACSAGLGSADASVFAGCGDSAASGAGVASAFVSAGAAFCFESFSGFFSAGLSDLILNLKSDFHLRSI